MPIAPTSTSSPLPQTQAPALPQGDPNAQVPTDPATQTPGPQTTVPGGDGFGQQPPAGTPAPGGFDIGGLLGSLAPAAIGAGIAGIGLFMARKGWGNLSTMKKVMAGGMMFTGASVAAMGGGMMASIQAQKQIELVKTQATQEATAAAQAQLQQTAAQFEQIMAQYGIDPKNPPAPGGTYTPPGGTPPSDPTTPGGTPPGSLPAGMWSAQALVGRYAIKSADPNMGATSNSQPGVATLTGVIGAQEGFATLAEAQAAAKAQMSTETQGSADLRWLVIQREGRFYAYTAQMVQEQGSTLPPLPQADGTVVGINALQYRQSGLNFVWMGYESLNGAGRWYDFMAERGGQQPQTQTPPAQQPPVQPGPGPQSPVPQQGPTGPGGNGGPGMPVGGAAEVGRGFAMPNVTETGVSAQGGWLQVHASLTPQGVATLEEAVQLARGARGTEPRTWDRWVVAQAGDGRFHVFKGSLVSARTPDVTQGFRAMYVLGPGFGEYFDGTSWRAVKA